MNKIEPQAWKHGADWECSEWRGEGDNGGKKGKWLDREHTWMTHGHGQQCGNWLWEWGQGAQEGKGGKLGQCNRITMKNDYLIKKKQRGSKYSMYINTLLALDI